MMCLSAFSFKQMDLEDNASVDAAKKFRRAGWMFWLSVPVWHLLLKGWMSMADIFANSSMHLTGVYRLSWHGQACRYTARWGDY